jgi:hypothetical protein
VLQLTQPSVELSTGQSKRRKLGCGKYFPIELPGAAGKDVAVDTDPTTGQPTPAGPQVMAVEAAAPVAEETPLVLVVEPQAPAWAQHTVRFLQKGELPEEQEEAERVARRSALYQFVDNVLYRKRPNGVKLKCISWEEGLELLAEIHGGICGSYIGSRALAGKAFWQGFFWPTTLQDATTLVTRCEACQFHSKKLHQPAQALQTIPLSWLFSVWGLDILAPFARAVGGFEYLYVAIDKFTKWPDVEPVRKVTTQSAVKFFKGLVCRFGVPNRVITDNGT